MTSVLGTLEGGKMIYVGGSGETMIKIEFKLGLVMDICCSVVERLLFLEETISL